jgi:hypothetical protein
VFADPDNGFEPDGRSDERHIRYAEVAGMLERLSGDSVVSVFQHFRRVRFAEDFARIKGRLAGLRSTAVCWDGRLMFVTVGKSADAMADVAAANAEYARRRPVVRAIR